MLKPTIDVLNNVCVMPYTMKNNTIRGGFEAGKRCTNALLSPHEVSPDRPEQFVFAHGNYLYAGPLWNHFGHIFVDSIHRLWAFKKNYDAIVFTGMIGLRDVQTKEDLQTWKYPKYFDEILELMGIQAKLHLVRTPTVFENLVVPEKGFSLYDGLKPFYRKYLKHYQERVVSAVEGMTCPEKLYYSRRHLIPSFGGIVGSSYLEHVLNENGFSICQPELSSIRQQFANILKSRALVFDEGSSIHLTSLLHDIPTRMFMLPRRRNIDNFMRSFEHLGDVKILADADDILMFKDRHGRHKPYCSCTYKNFEKIIGNMQTYGLVSGDFDSNQFFQLKMKDFKAAAEGAAGVFS